MVRLIGEPEAGLGEVAAQRNDPRVARRLPQLVPLERLANPPPSFLGGRGTNHAEDLGACAEQELVREKRAKKAGRSSQKHPSGLSRREGVLSGSNVGSQNRLRGEIHLVRRGGTGTSGAFV